ncbi:MAG TPA: MarP family serine protease [Actinomycetota bacterium]|nr:MarP family serine protease [Actinomycetota bacterium]
MSLIDVAIILLLVAAVAHGVTQGAAIQVLSFGGLIGGFVAGAALATVAAGMVQTQQSKALVSMSVFFISGLIGGMFGRTLGTHAWKTLQELRLGVADALLGAVFAAIATLAAVWLFTVLLSKGPTQTISSAIHSSAIVRALEDRLPGPPTVLARLGQLIDTSKFPQVFEGLEPGPAPPVALPPDPAVRAAVAAAGRATVRVFGPACGGVQTGSGFVAAPGLVVTNAHVVAGMSGSITVQDAKGRHRAQVMLFDPSLDVAVLRTSGLAAGPLPIAPAAADRGTQGAFLGYPGGGPFQAAPAAVLRTFQATGRDIYGRNTTRRNVYQLSGAVREGNSGGPLVRPSGEVIGVIFAASTTDDNVGYALTSTEVLPRVREAQGRSAAVSSGPCAA